MHTELEAVLPSVSCTIKMEHWHFSVEFSRVFIVSAWIVVAQWESISSSRGCALRLNDKVALVVDEKDGIKKFFIVNGHVELLELTCGPAVLGLLLDKAECALRPMADETSGSEALDRFLALARNSKD